METPQDVRVMVIDDDQNIREVLSDLFEAMGWEPVAVADPKEVPALFLREPFDLITLDYNMPGLSGQELHRILSQEFSVGRRIPGTNVAPHQNLLPPILLITGLAEEAEVVMLQFRESVFGTISKPFQMGEVRAAAEEAVAAGRRRKQARTDTKNLIHR